MINVDSKKVINFIVRNTQTIIKKVTTKKQTEQGTQEAKVLFTLKTFIYS